MVFRHVLNRRPRFVLRHLLAFCLGISIAISLGFWLTDSTSAQPMVTTLACSEATTFTAAEDNVSTSMERAQAHYDATQYIQAEAAWQEVISSLDATTQQLPLARACSNLSLAQQQLGKWDAARENSDRALMLLDIPTAQLAHPETIQPVQRDRPTLKMLAQSLDIRGQIAFLTGDTENALGNWRSAQSIYEQTEDVEGYLRNRLNQAQAYQVLGQYLEAKHLLGDVAALLPGMADSGCRAFQGTETGRFKDEDAVVLDGEFEARAWWQLGKGTLLLGRLEDAICYLNQADAKAHVLDVGAQASLAMDKGHVYRAQAIKARDLGLDSSNVPADFQDPEKSALMAYQKAQTKLVKGTASPMPPSWKVLQLQAIANQISLKVAFELKDMDNIQQQLTEAETLLNSPTLPLGRDTIYAQTSIGESLIKWVGKSSENVQPSSKIPELEQATQLLGYSVDAAHRLGDKRAESYAAGHLAQAYFQNYLYSGKQADRQNAEIMNQQATALSIVAKAPDILYQWQYQLGQILEEQDRSAALSAYRGAVATLESVRSGLLLLSPDFRYAFRDEVEPVYRDLVSLLLIPEDSTIKEDSSTKNERNPSIQDKVIQESIQVIEALHIAEIENFLQCRLANSISANEDLLNLKKDTAFIYPIILNDRIEIIFQFQRSPDQEDSGIFLTHASVTSINFNNEKKFFNKEAFGKLLDSFATKISNEDLERNKEPAEIYRWIFKPIEDLLEEYQTNELVFVLDGKLRNIQIPALSDPDEEKYLVEKDYTISILPSLTLFEFKDWSFPGISVFFGGISDPINLVEESKDFEALNIEAEVEVLNSIDSVSTAVVRNQGFTLNELRDAVQSGEFSAIHLATHGQFSADPDETFILAYNELIDANNWDKLLIINQFADFPQPLELLVLSACETAKGDDRAVLGLAGIAVRSGARSTLASLWQVDDYFTGQFMRAFYTELSQGASRSQAAHIAQQAIFSEQKNPFFWAPFVLVGNWL